MRGSATDGAGTARPAVAARATGVTVCGACSANVVADATGSVTGATACTTPVVAGVATAATVLTTGLVTAATVFVTGSVTVATDLTTGAVTGSTAFVTGSTAVAIGAVAVVTVSVTVPRRPPGPVSPPLLPVCAPALPASSIPSTPSAIRPPNVTNRRRNSTPDRSATPLSWEFGKALSVGEVLGNSIHFTSLHTRLIPHPVLRAPRASGLVETHKNFGSRNFAAISARITLTQLERVMTRNGDGMQDVVRRAEWAVHQRARSACAAATGAGVPGRFRAWEPGGVLAVSATEPALGHLSVVTGVTRATLSPAVDLVRAPGWDGVPPTLILRAELGAPQGLVRDGKRPLAVSRVPSAARPQPDVVEADDTFVDVLLAGYEAAGPVAGFIAAEHRQPGMRRFVVLADGLPVAAAAMSVHDGIAVLGGASTLPAHRGRGGQSRLLEHRLWLAAEAGCTLAVATARADSVSAANLRRAGFEIHARTAWRAA
jgi:GNAT superfamily N-acetyltransferase